jgi:hypothetical protein
MASYENFCSPALSISIDIPISHLWICDSIRLHSLKLTLASVHWFRNRVAVQDYL